MKQKKNIEDLISYLKDKGRYDLTMSVEQMIGLEKTIKWLIEYTKKHKSVRVDP